MRDFVQFSDIDNLEKERLCSFFYRHGEARGKPETQEETCGSLKTSISCQKYSNFGTFTTSRTTSFVASRIDTAKPVTFSDTFVSNRFCSFPYRHCEAFCTVSSQLITCHACHAMYTLSPLRAGLPTRFRQNTQHATSQILRLPRKRTMESSKVMHLPPAMKNATHALKTSKRYCACHAKRLSTRHKTRLPVTTCHACHAK